MRIFDSTAFLDQTFVPSLLSNFSSKDWCCDGRGMNSDSSVSRRGRRRSWVRPSEWSYAPVHAYDEACLSERKIPGEVSALRSCLQGRYRAFRPRHKRIHLLCRACANGIRRELRQDGSRCHSLRKVSG